MSAVGRMAEPSPGGRGHRPQHAMALGCGAQVVIATHPGFTGLCHYFPFPKGTGPQEHPDPLMGWQVESSDASARAPFGAVVE
jgi:hypothetical protein